MKTIRELLLERHRQQEPKLDQLRAQVLARELQSDATDEQRGDIRSSPLAVLRAWLRFDRVAWGSFATAWVAIIALNLAANDEPAAASSAGDHADAGEVLEGLMDYQAQLAQLLNDSPAEPDALESTGPRVPGPRGAVDRPRRDARLRTAAFA